MIKSTPDSGTLVPGRSVALVVSTGKPQVAVPALGLGTEPADRGSTAALKVHAGLLYRSITSDAYSSTTMATEGGHLGDPPSRHRGGTGIGHHPSPL